MKYFLRSQFHASSYLRWAVCQLQAHVLKVLVSLPRKSGVRLTDSLDKTKVVDWEVNRQTNQPGFRFF